MSVVFGERWPNTIVLSMQVILIEVVIVIAYRKDMVMSVIPSDFACWYIEPSTSVETALVHSVEVRLVKFFFNI